MTNNNGLFLLTRLISCQLRVPQVHMNLNQSAHGDREHGYLAARMRLPRKIIMGCLQDEEPHRELGEWMRAAVGNRFSRDLRIMRFGDNMREVAITEGDKIEAQIKLGWMVNTWLVGYLVEEMSNVSEVEIDAKLDEYRSRYKFQTSDIASVGYQTLEEAAMLRIFQREKIGAFSNTFQDLYGLRQLSGLASQNLMADRYGYGGEGDWKVTGMPSVIMAMTDGMSVGTTFITGKNEPYHYLRFQAGFKIITMQVKRDARQSSSWAL